MIDAYLATLEPPRRERGEALDALVRKIAPDAAIDMSYRMPTYRLGEHFVAWASQKRCLSVYTCSAERSAAFRAKRPKIKAGVGCVNFKDTDPFPIDDLKTLVRDALKPSAEILAREAASRGKKGERKREGQPR
ncbi:MAG: iron chaperone [Reyranellaceae bacterium]